MDELRHLDPDWDAVPDDLRELDGQIGMVTDHETGETFPTKIVVPVRLFGWQKRMREGVYDEAGVDPYEELQRITEDGESDLPPAA
jgi:hypothetical protein